jgi:hypothetical protein
MSKQKHNKKENPERKALIDRLFHLGLPYRYLQILDDEQLMVLCEPKNIKSFKKLNSKYEVELLATELLRKQIELLEPLNLMIPFIELKNELKIDKNDPIQEIHNELHQRRLRDIRRRESGRQ